ncbi:MAG: FtsX-like permease family protein [Candidatus Bathyarchaeia archaeon]
MEFVILAFEALKERKVRSIFTIFMVIIGVTLIVGVESVSLGARRFIAGEFEKFGTNIIIVTASGGEPIPQAFMDDMKLLPQVKAVIPVVSRPATITARGITKDCMIIGIDFNYLPMLVPKLKLLSGDYPSEYDTMGIALGYQVAFEPDGSAFAEVNSPVQVQVVMYAGSRIDTIRKSFIVRGIFDYFGSFAIPIDICAWIPLENAMRIFNSRGYDTVYVLVTSETYLNETVKYIQSKYNIRATTAEEIKNTIDNVLKAIDMYIGAISVVALLVAGIGIITTLYTSMLERIREIGVLKAIGFKDRHVLMLFLYEAILIGVFGSIFGVFGGIGLSYAIIDVFFSRIGFPVKPFFTIEAFLKSIAMAIGLSIAAGLYPAWRASKLDPVVALRHE